MGEFLSQDEVDSLLKGLSGDADEAPVHPDAKPGEIRPYDFASHERIVRGHMPTLEIINERFAQSLRIDLSRFISSTPEISIGTVRVLKFGEFMRNQTLPASLNIIQAKPLNRNGLFVFDSNLVFMIVDNLFGGDGRFHTRVEGREFTQTEQRIIQKMIAVAFENYEKSWENFHPLKFDFVRSEINPQFANIATPTEVVVVTTFDIELGGNGGAFHICMPYSMLEPIKDLLYSSMQDGEHLVTDQRWSQLLSMQVQSADIELVATLGPTSVTLEEVLKMRIGDIVPLESGENIIASVAGIPVMECKYGVFDNQYALKVKKMILTNEGEGHV